MAELVRRRPFSLETLVAEAKRRMWRRRGLVAAVAVVLAAGATGLGLELSSRGAGSAGVRSSTSLRLLVDGAVYNGPGVFHLNCDPPGGDVPNPAAACAAIAAQPDTITKPEVGGCLAPWRTLEIRGRMNGKPVNGFVAACSGNRTRLIHKLLGVG
jgi:hypothetical protein